MKKLIKFLIAAGAIIGGIAGVIYFLDKKKENEIFEDDAGDLEDVFDEDEDDRDYVTLEFEDEDEEESEDTEEN